MDGRERRLSQGRPYAAEAMDGRDTVPGCAHLAEIPKAKIVQFLR